MIYNIHYDVCAVLIYAFTLYCILIKKDIQKRQNKVFIVIIVSGLITTAFDILSAIADAQVMRDPSKMAFSYVMNYGYLLTHNVMPFLFVVYVLMMTNLYVKFSKLSLCLLTVPILADVVVMVLNAPFQWIFTYDEHNRYIHAPMINLLYLNAFLYIGLSLYYTYKCRKNIPKNKVIALVIFVFSSLLSIILQYIFSSVLLELFVQSLAFLGILFTIDNEDEIYNGITGVYNRREFLLENMTSLKGQLDYYVISVKFLNHSYYDSVLGIEVMNQVMRAIARWLKQLVPESNTYDCENGEFSLMLYMQTEEEVMEAAEKIQEQFREAWIYKDISVAFSTQICVIHLPEDVNTIEKLMTMVDTAHSRNNQRVSLVYASQLSFLQREILVEQAIQKALAEKHFQVYYQPIWNGKSNSIHSAEALVRLFDEELGFIPPDEFIPIAEKNGTIVQIGEFVFEEVCKLFHEMDIRKLGIRFIEVNLSVIQCMYRNLAERFEEIMKKYEVSAEWINLEITESVAANSPEMFIHTMQRLRNMGFTFSMDDYGTGYSNLSYMFDLDFDMIKLDKSILWNAEKNSNINIIFKNTIRMIKDMNLKVVVEGVETEAQKMYISELEGDYCQGYYFSRPVDKENFIQYCKDYNQ